MNSENKGRSPVRSAREPRFGTGDPRSRMANCSESLRQSPSRVPEQTREDRNVSFVLNRSAPRSGEPLTELMVICQFSVADHHQPVSGSTMGWQVASRPRIVSAPRRERRNP